MTAEMNAPMECEVFVEVSPELQPNFSRAPNATASAQTMKRGAILEVPQSVGLNAQLKANSPHGSMVLEDLQFVNGYQQKVGENTLNYRLQVDGQLSMNRNGVAPGSHRLEVDLTFLFTCQLVLGGGMPDPMGGFSPMGGCGGGGMMGAGSPMGPSPGMGPGYGMGQ